MLVSPIKTDLYKKEENLIRFIERSLSEPLENGDVLAVSTKLVSVSEGRTFPKDQLSKKELVEKESDHFMGEIGYGIFLTVKHGIFIPSAGIDASNSEAGEYLLYPEKPFDSAQKIWQELKNTYGLDQLGVVLVDSHTTPLRRGTTGVALSYWGFQGVRDYRGTPDIYNSPLEYTFLNLVDSLAATANLLMGEGNDLKPLVKIEGAELNFSDTIDPKEIMIDPEEDLYRPIFKNLIE